MKSQLSSFEIGYLVSELQFLLGAKVEKIFQQEKPKDDFLFVFHVPGKGKQFLFSSLPSVFCLSDFKPVFPFNPPFFASSLRRKLSNARVQKVYQKAFERIIIFELSTALGSSFLIFELFNPGNIILCDGNWKILSLLHPKKWSDRSLLPAKPYEFPPLQLDPRSLGFEEFKKLLLESSMDSIVKSLAVDFSLGGVYAEEVVFNTGLDKSLSPSSLDDSALQKLFDSLNALFALPLDPHRSSLEVFPVRLNHIDALENVPSFNQAIQDLVLSNLERAESQSFLKSTNKAKSKFEKVISAQEAQLKSLEVQEKDSQIKGELIYTHYQSLKILLDKISSLRAEGLSWDEVFKIIKEVPQVKKLDGSKAILELDLGLVQ